MSSDHFRVRVVETALEAARVVSLVHQVVPDADVREVGSTAVVGAIGKGDIDVLVRVHAGEFSKVRGRLDRAFARNPDQLSSEDFQGYLVPSHLDVAIQLTVLGGPHDDFLRFADLLRASPRLLAEYNALKRAHDGAPMDLYRAAKAAFIESVLTDHDR